jgi:predicted nucleic acid-binding protein
LNVFLDANIILDFLNSSRKQHLLSKELIYYIYNVDSTIVISEDILTNIFYIEKDKIKVLNFFKQIQHKWTISPFGKSVISQSLNLSLSKNLDLEDVLQCLCAKNNNCDIFITNDTTFHNCGIKIQTPQQFINEHSNS